jgi:type II secretory pathway pseudopilin PulG
MKRSCFTLIELLVVIAITTLLLAIIVFVLAGIRQQTRALACRTNIRQVTLDLLMYETDNETFPYGFRDSMTPPPGGFVGNMLQDRLGWWWFHAMEGYTDTKKEVLRCPSKILNNPSLKDNILYGNYGVNRSICKCPEGIQSHQEFIGASLSKTEIPQPSRTLLIVDCGYSITSWWHATDNPPVSFTGNRGEDMAYVPGLAINEDKHLLPEQKLDAMDGRHPNKTVNVGFIGLNISPKQADELFVEKKLDGYRNKIPLWSPE